MTRGVPVELTSFVGRRKELAEGRRMLRAARLVTVAGPGGVGKTRLAGRLAHQVQRLFPDGVVWVGLATQRDPAALASEVAAALDVETQGLPVEDAIAAYLKSRELLLVLDNCEHLAEACAELVTGLLRDAPRIRMLATSRRPLGVSGEHLISLQPLALPTPEEAASGAIGHVEAVALLADRARSGDRAFRLRADNAEVVSRLVRRVDGIPLAIELAAARLRVLSVAELAERLDDRFGVLTTGSRVAPPRHQTLRALIDWSHDLCSPEEQALWARMSVFDGGADLPAVEAVAGEPGVATPDALAGLVDGSVLSVSEIDGRIRYRMLDTIRQYGAEQLAARGETAQVRDRHRDHFLGIARESRASWIGPDQLGWLARVTLDLGNMRAAFEHSLTDPHDRTNALELASSLVWFWPQAGATDEGSRWFSKAVADPDEPSPLLMQGLVAAIFVASERGDKDTALPLARRAAALPHSRHVADHAAHHVAVATEALLTGDHASAATAYEKAIAGYQSAGDPHGQLECLATGANLANHLGYPDDALSMVEQAVRLCDVHGELCWRAYLLYSRGDLLWDLGRSVEALAAVRSSLEYWSVLEPVAIAGALHVVAWAYLDDGHERIAAVLLGVRQRIREDHGVRPAPFRSTGRYAATEAKIIEAIGEDEFRTAHDEGFAMPLADAVQLALGRETFARRKATGDRFPVVLSKREGQVAALVARGFSNKEIAEELVISQRTAEGHVAKVMDKLGAHSRDQVAAWFADRAPAQE